MRDDEYQKRHTERMQLWNDFNICWLAVCQRQKDLTQDVVASGRQPPQASLLNRDRMEAMGKELIQLCDQMEQHGLVDYQMGIWEEEILSGRWMHFSPVFSYFPVFLFDRLIVPGVLIRFSCQHLLHGSILILHRSSAGSMSGSHREQP